MFHRGCRVWESIFGRKIRCFENFCSLCSPPAQEKATLLAEGHRAKAEAGISGRYVPEGSWVGSGLGSWLPFCWPQHWASRFRVGCQAMGQVRRETGHPSWAPGPQNRVLRGSRASRSSRGPEVGLSAALVQAQWSRLAPMQAA